MDSARTLRRAAVAASLVVCVVASFAYTGAVTAAAFFAFVLVAAFVAGSVTALIGQPRQVGGLLAGLAVAAMWAAAVNALSGETSGPVARSSLCCGVASALAVYSTRRLWAPAFLLAVAVGIGGALYYGAAGEVRVVSIVAGAASLATIALIDGVRHRRALHRPSTAGVLVGCLLACLLAVAAVGISAAADRALHRSASFTSSLVDPDSIHPPWAVRASTMPTTNPLRDHETTQGSSHVAIPNNTSLHQQRSTLRVILLIALVAVMLMLIVLSARFLLGAYRLRRWKRQLQDLPPAESTAAAWVWMMFLLGRLGWQPRANPAIDLMVDDMRVLGWPGQVCEPAGDVAVRGTAATFARDGAAGASPGTAWASAERAVAAARCRTHRARRARAFIELLRT